MNTMQFSFHVINLLLFLLTAVNYAYTITYIKRTPCREFTKEYMYKESVAGIGVATAFMAMQADWVLQQHNQAVGEATSWGWLVFDYCLAIFLIWNADRIRHFCQERLGMVLRDK